jgi:hypothetical protein
LDPNSHLGLGDYPLKRFLFAILKFGLLNSTEQKKPDLLISS